MTMMRKHIRAQLAYSLFSGDSPKNWCGSVTVRSRIYTYRYTVCTYICIDILEYVYKYRYTVCTYISIYVYIHTWCDTTILVLKYKYMNSATPQFATNSARVTADINPCAYCAWIQMYEKIFTNVNILIHPNMCLKSILWTQLYFFILHCVHCALVRVIYSRNIGRFPQIPAKPKTFDAGTLV